MLQNIVVDNPCTESGPQTVQQAPRAQLIPFDRAGEEQKMGNFDLEEGVKNMLLCLGEDCEFNLDELEEFNANMDNMIRSNNIQRG